MAPPTPNGRAPIAGRRGVWRPIGVTLAVLLAHAVAFGSGIVSTPVVGAQPSGDPVGSVFDTPDPEPAPRVTQPRNVTSIVPARLLETRVGPNERTVDGRFRGGGALGDGVTLELDVAGRGGVPKGAAAALLNVTAVAPAGPGFLTVFPCGQQRPLSSNVNYQAGEVVPNAVLAKLTGKGTVCIFTLRATHVVVDVNGFVSAESGTTSLVPARLLETRSGPTARTVDGRMAGGGPIGDAGVLQMQVTGRGGVPDDADAVLLNVTGIDSAGPGFITVFPCGQQRPVASNLNYAAGEVVANAVLAKVGTNGSVCIFSSRSTDAVVDVNGYVAAGRGTASLAPVRLLETRSGPDLVTIDGRFEGIGAVAGGTVVELEVAGRGGLPDVGVGAAMLNVTAVAPSGPGFVTVFPCGQARPNASNVNFDAGDVVPNAVLARIGNGGKVCIFTSTTTHIVVDVNGWFDLPPNQPESNVTVLEPAAAAFQSLSPPGELQTPSLLTDPAAPLVPNPEMARITTDTSNLGVGDLIVVTKPSGEPYYGRISQKDGSGVTTEQVALAEVMPVMDVALDADTDTGRVVKRDGGESISGVEIDRNDQTTTGPEPSRGGCAADARIDITASAQADAGRFVFDVSIGFFQLNSARIGYNPSVSASATISASASVRCDWSKTLVTRKLPTIKFFVGPIPVWITQEVSVGIGASITATAAGSRTLTANAEAFVGIVYENGQWDRETSITFDVTQDSEADIRIDAVLSAPTVTYSARAYGIVGFDATVAGVLRLEVRPLAKKYVRLTASIDVEVSLVIELDLTVVALRWSQPFVNATVFGPLELWSLSRSIASCDTTWPSGIGRAQCEALVDLWDIADGPRWRDAAGWVENTDPCTWEGVVCSGGNVRQLVLDGRSYQRPRAGSTPITIAKSPSGIDGPLPSELGDLVGLQILRLDFAKIDTVPSSIGDMQQLEQLQLTATGLRSVPSAIGRLASLTLLELGSNELTSLPPTIGDLSQLRVLEVLDNPLTTLPRQVGDLGQLRRLDARGAELSTVPASVNQLTELRDLWLDHNPLTSMPDLGDLAKLEVLFLAESNLTTLPAGIGRLGSLEYLDASRMQLTTIPAEVGNLANIGLLFLYDNRIGGDITDVIRRLRANSPDVRIDLRDNACPTVSDAGLRVWMSTASPGWNAGC